MVAEIEFVVAWGRGGTYHCIRHESFKLFEIQRTVIEGAWQTEAIFHKGLLAGSVSIEHAFDLREADVGLVNQKKIVFREIVHQAEWPLARLTFIDVSRIVLNARATTEFLKGFHVLSCSHLKALRFKEFSFGTEVFETVLKLFGDGDAGFFDSLSRRSVVIGWVDRECEIALMDFSA